MNIADIKKSEIQEIYDFLEGIKEYGHIFHLEPKLLDEPFGEILKGIEKIQQMMKDSWSM
jgi:hypothetical protein